MDFLWRYPRTADFHNLFNFIVMHPIFSNIPLVLICCKLIPAIIKGCTTTILIFHSAIFGSFQRDRSCIFYQSFNLTLLLVYYISILLTNMLKALFSTIMLQTYFTTDNHTILTQNIIFKLYSFKFESTEQ